MLGSVAADASEPLLPLTLLGTPLGGAEDGTSGRTDVEAVINTGFDGELTLHEETIRRLGYPYSGTASGTLADGSEAQFYYHEGLVLWHGVERPVAVIVAAGQPPHRRRGAGRRGQGRGAALRLEGSAERTAARSAAKRRAPVNSREAPPRKPRV